ncbi:MAG: hypothetical protein JOZ51_20585, partial [Chloroflexi bacterium]|nr:hypothetical protein [Chloroflexota bacterium]
MAAVGFEPRAREAEALGASASLINPPPERSMNTTRSLHTESTTSFYQAYGLTIRSQIPLPELIASPAASADITIRRDTIARPPELAQSSERCLWSTPDEACLFWADAGTILVRGGDELIVEPLPHVDEQVLRIYLLGPAL